jgi:hypothetical protein
MARGYVSRWCVLAALATSCLIDKDDVCGAHQHHLNEGYLEGCVCDDGAVPKANGVGCRLCGQHEVVRAEACSCESGYARASTSAPCIAIDDAPVDDAGTSGPATSGQDTPCSSSADCEGLDATYCLTLQPPARCLVQGCADDPNICDSQRECCAITVLPELAATRGLCVPTGTCAAPGMVVTP